MNNFEDYLVLMTEFCFAFPRFPNSLPDIRGLTPALESSDRF
jgi:hypothetical protein